VKWLETDVFEFPWYQSLKSDYSLKSTININARRQANISLRMAYPQNMLDRQMSHNVLGEWACMHGFGIIYTYQILKILSCKHHIGKV
jgi:hypothetical protein